MDAIPIRHWQDIAAHNWQALLLGNGASIALHQGFGYPTLHSVAASNQLLPTTAPIFASLGTTDFEHVLLACWYADRVNRSLGGRAGGISAAYEEVRNALIESVHVVHPAHADIASELERVAAYATRFKTVVTLNYDLTMYWAMLLFNAMHGPWFKDAFLHGEFIPAWEFLRRPYEGVGDATLVFYPHGSLSIARDYLGEETKLAAIPSDLLGTITRTWTSGGHIPVFVSEGTSKQKLAAIRRSHYLSNVYERVLPTLGDSIVVYGWSVDERDIHIIEAIATSQPQCIAISVYTGQSKADQQAFCHRVAGVVGGLLPESTLLFFDSQSSGCWSNA